MSVRSVLAFIEVFAVTLPITGLCLWFYDGQLRRALRREKKQRQRELALKRELALLQFKWRRLLDAIIFHEEHPGASRPYWFSDVFDKNWCVLIDHTALEKRFDESPTKKIWTPPPRP